MADGKPDEAAESSPVGEESEAVIEKGEQGRTQRDMQTVTTGTVVEEPRVPFDPRNLDKVRCNARV